MLLVVAEIPFHISALQTLEIYDFRGLTSELLTTWQVL